MMVRRDKVKRFDKITIGNETVLGSGYYQESSRGLIIDSGNEKVISFFRSAIRDNKHLGTIVFEADGVESIYSGSFIVISINGNVIELVKGY